MKVEEVKGLLDSFFGYMEEWIDRTSIFKTEEQKAGNDVIRPRCMCPFSYYDSIIWNCMKAFGEKEEVGKDKSSLLFRITVQRNEGEAFKEVNRVIASIITKSIEKKFGKMEKFTIANGGAQIHGYPSMAPDIEYLRRSDSLSFMPNPSLSLIMMDKIGRMFKSQMSMYFIDGYTMFSSNDEKMDGLPSFGYDSIIEMFHNLIDDKLAMAVIPVIVDGNLRYSPVCCTDMNEVGAPVSINSTMFNSYDGAFEFIIRSMVEDDNRERLLDSYDNFMVKEREKRMTDISVAIANNGDMPS